MMKSWLSSDKNAMEPFFLRGKVKKNGRDRRSGRSSGVFLVSIGGRMQPKVAANKVEIANRDGGLGDGSAQVPPVKREAPLRQLPF